MAELLAFGRDQKGLTATPKLNSDGSGSIALASGTLHPELRLTASEVAAALTAWTAKPAPTPPAPTPVPAPPQPTPTTSVIFGTNDGSGWNRAPGLPASEIIAAGMTSERLEGTGGLALSKACGFKDQVVIVGNTSSGSSLVSVNVTAHTAQVLREAEACAAAGVELLEFGNEMYLKGRSHNGEGAAYAALFVSAWAAIKAKGLNVKLLANCDAVNWIASMTTAQLKTIVEAGGFTIHPYGDPSWSYGLAGYLEQLALAGENVPYYVTEYGCELNGTTTQYPGWTFTTEAVR
jgi:hypothetical protein